MKLPCLCCGYLTLIERGQWDICRVCFWEDDGADLFDSPWPADVVNPCNGVSLNEARANFARVGAVETRLIPYTRKPLPEEIPPRGATTPLPAPESPATEAPRSPQGPPGASSD